LFIKTKERIAMLNISPAMKKKIKSFIWPFFRTILIIGIAFMILYPIFVKVATSIKSDDDMHDSTVIFLPKEPTLLNFSLVIKGTSYFKTLGITATFTLLVSLLQLASCTLVGYGFARFDFPGKKISFALVIATLVIPTQCILVPLYLRFRFFNIFQTFQFGGIMTGVTLTDTVWPFILLSATAVAFKNGLYIFMLRQYFRGIPSSLEEAAYIDGCGVFKTFYRIILPGAVPMLVTVFLFSFVWQWNDYYYTKMLAPDLPLLNVKLVSMTMSGLDTLTENMYQSLLAAPKFLLLIAPLVVLYLFTQRFFTESIETSGLVG